MLMCIIAVTFFFISPPCLLFPIVPLLFPSVRSFLVIEIMDQSGHFSHQPQPAYSVRSPSIPSPRVYPGYITSSQTGNNNNNSSSSNSSQQHLYPSMGMNGGASAPNFRKAAALMHHQQQQRQQQQHALYTPQEQRKRISIISDSCSLRSDTGGVYTANPAIHDNVPPMPPIQACYRSQQRQQRRPVIVDDHYMQTNGTAQSMYFYPQHSQQQPTESLLPGVFPAPPSGLEQQQPRKSDSNNANNDTSGWKFWRNTSRRTKKIPLFQGNLILDCPVPTRLLEANARKDQEFNQMRYSAVTCDPDDFMDSQYTLRPCLMKRQTEIFIVMTMYNVRITTTFFPV